MWTRLALVPVAGRPLLGFVATDETEGGAAATAHHSIATVFQGPDTLTSRVRTSLIVFSADHALGN